VQAGKNQRIIFDPKTIYQKQQNKNKVKLKGKWELGYGEW